MRIEVLYVTNCPHLPTAVKQLKAILSAEGVADEIQEVEVKDGRSAEQFKFRGSPTIRINGRDIDLATQASELFALACRIYPGAKETSGPCAKMMRRAIREALEEEKI